MRNMALVLMLVAVIAITGACQRQSASVELFFATEGNETLSSEWRRVEFRNTRQKLTRTLEELVAGPTLPQLYRAVSAETKILAVKLDGTDVTVNLSRDYLSFGGVLADLMARVSIVNTLTALPEVERVRILVEGEELKDGNGQPLGYCSFVDLSQPSAQQVTLYFADDQAMYLVAEMRTIQLPPGADLLALGRAIVEELIKGPVQSGLGQVIPREVRVRSVSYADGTFYIDFSEEMHTRHSGGAAGEAMTLGAIVNSLTELTQIRRVMMTVNGGTMNIEHVVVEEPLTRNEAIIR